MLYVSAIDDLFTVYVISPAEGSSEHSVGGLVAGVGIVAH